MRQHVPLTRLHHRPFLPDGEDAELLVYLVDEEMDIYIGGSCLLATSLAGRSPAESLGCLGVAESLRTGQRRPRRGLYKRTEKTEWKI